MGFGASKGIERVCRIDFLGWVERNHMMLKDLNESLDEVGRKISGDARKSRKFLCFA